MADNKPWILISENMEKPYYPRDCVDIIKQHFNVVFQKDYLKNPAEYNSKIQVVFQWYHQPKVDTSLLTSLSSLKLVINQGSGFDHLDVPFINSLGVKVAVTPNSVTNSTADMAMALLLASARKIISGYQLAIKLSNDPNNAGTPRALIGDDVTDSTVGIIGMGRIGIKIAQRCKGFDMKIIYHNRTRRSVEEEQAVGATYCSTIDDLLKEADFVVAAVSLSSASKGLIGHKELSLMKPTATLVNVSRGLVVDHDALVKALHAGTIRAAALDVTYPEPLPKDHPLLSTPNVIITPHIASNTNATAIKTVKIMIENSLAAVKGDSPPDEVKLN